MSDKINKSEKRENKEAKARKEKQVLIDVEAVKDVTAEYMALLDNELDPFKRLEILLLELIRKTKDKA